MPIQTAPCTSSPTFDGRISTVIGLRTALLTFAFAFGAVLSPAMADEPMIDLSPANSAPALVKTLVLDDPARGITRSYFGEISAKETVGMGFQVSGRITEFHAPEGELIPQGTVIAQLDPIPFEIAVEQARLTLEQAQRQLSRFEQLVGTTVPEAQVLDARTEVRLAEVALRDAEYALDQTTLSAPFDALVAGRTMANFSTVAAGAEVVRLHDMSELRVDIEVPEVLIQRMGGDPEITLRARFPGTEETHPLVFREMNAEISEVGQTFRATLALAAPTDRLLFPGASVVVEATMDDAPGGFVVPTSAIATGPDGSTYALRLEGSGDTVHLVRMPVSVSVSAQGDITIIGGLSAGQEIVVGGVHLLDDGQSVRRFTAQF